MSQQQTFTGTGIPGAADIQFVAGNDGVSVPPNPATHVINIVGNTTQGVSTSGNAGTFTETITVANATTAQIGVTSLATNAETIAGVVTTKATTPDDIKAKLGVQTLHGLALGNGTAGAVAWLGEAQNGYIPIGSTGNNPVLGPITSLDGSIAIALGAGTIDLSVTGTSGGSGITVGAVTADIATFALGALAGTYQLEARVKGFEATGPSSAGYNLFATFITDGVTATLVGQQTIFNESAALVNADAYFIASGGSAVIQVLGAAGLTIQWTATGLKT